MQKIWYWIKRIVVFMVSSLLVSWLTAFLFFALINHFVDLSDISNIEIFKMSEHKENIFFNSFFADAFIAFLIMYIVGFALLRSYKFKTAKFIVLSIISYLILFIILALFA